MPLREFIINDIKPVHIDALVKDVQHVFNNLTYTHIPIQKDGVYIGCMSETDIHCFQSDQPLSEYLYTAEGFYVRDQTVWLDVIEAFAQSDSNIMPVLDGNNTYLGYYELNDILSIFNTTPFFAESGGILIVEKGYNDYSFSELSQIVESNNATMLGAFISKKENDMVQITLKTNQTLLGDIIQSFRRYGYHIISGHEDDSYLEQLKERSDYLNKYLNL